MIKIYFAGKEIPVPDVIYRNNINSPNNPINTLDESPANINLLHIVPSRIHNADCSNNLSLESVSELEYINLPVENATSITISDKPIKATSCTITKVSECICSSKDLFWYGCKCLYSQRNKQ